MNRDISVGDGTPRGRVLEVVLSPGSGPITLEFLDDGEAVIPACELDDKDRPHAVRMFERLASEIGSRPDLFIDRILFISMHAISQGRSDASRDRKLVERVGSRLLPRLQELAEDQDLLLEISIDAYLLVSPTRDPGRRGRWSEHCQSLVKPLIGEERADSIRVYGLKEGTSERLTFREADERGPCLPDPEATPAAPHEPHDIKAGVLAEKVRTPVTRTMYYHEEPTPRQTWSFRLRRLELAPYEVRFTPTWDSRNQIVSVFSAEPVRLIDKRCLRGFRAIPEALEDEKLLLRLCHALLEASADQVRTFMADGQAGMVVVPIHFDALITSWRLTRYLRALRALEPEVTRRLCIVVTDVPAGVDGYTLQNIVDSLRLVCRAVFLRIGVNDPHWAMRLVNRVQAVGIEFWSDPRSEVELVGHLERFAEACRKRQVDAYLTGLNSTSLVLAAAAAGIRYISGDRIMPPQRFPQGAHRYSWMDFYMQGGS